MADSEKLSKHTENTAHERSKHTPCIMRKEKSGSGHPHSLATHEESQKMQAVWVSLKTKA